MISMCAITWTFVDKADCYEDLFLIVGFKSFYEILVRDYARRISRVVLLKIQSLYSVRTM